MQSLGQKSPKNHPVLKLDEKLNPRKRQLSNSDKSHDVNNHKIKHYEAVPAKVKPQNDTPAKPLRDKSPKKLVQNAAGPENHKKLASDKKRLESMKMKREEFKQKKMIISTGLSGIVSIMYHIIANIT